MSSERSTTLREESVDSESLDQRSESPLNNSINPDVNLYTRFQTLWERYVGLTTTYPDIQGTQRDLQTSTSLENNLLHVLNDIPSGIISYTRLTNNVRPEQLQVLKTLVRHRWTQLSEEWQIFLMIELSQQTARADINLEMKENSVVPTTELQIKPKPEQKLPKCKKNCTAMEWNDFMTTFQSDLEMYGVKNPLHVLQYLKKCLADESDERSFFNYYIDDIEPAQFNVTKCFTFMSSIKVGDPTNKSLWKDFLSSTKQNGDSILCTRRAT